MYTYIYIYIIVLMHVIVYTIYKLIVVAPNAFYACFCVLEGEIGVLHVFIQWFTTRNMAEMGSVSIHPQVHENAREGKNMPDSGVGYM